MPIVRVPAEITLDDLIDVVEQLPADELTVFTRRVIGIQARRGIPLLVDEEEQALLNVIHAGLSEVVQQRLDELRDKSREGTLTPAEHVELLSFVQQVEQQDVARAQALVDLAKKRDTTVSDLMHELGLNGIEGG